MLKAAGGLLTAGLAPLDAARIDEGPAVRIKDVEIRRGVTIQADNGTRGSFGGSPSQDLKSLEPHLARIRELLVGRDPLDPSLDGEWLWESLYPGRAKLYAEGRDPSDEMLRDMRRMQRFFESIPFHRMAPHDELRSGGTDWVLADPERGGYLLYTYDDAEALGVRSLRPGRYTLRWSDPATGHEETRRNIEVSGEATFEKPRTIGSEAVLYVAPAD